MSLLYTHFRISIRMSSKICLLFIDPFMFESAESCALLKEYNEQIARTTSAICIGQ